jgi:hypothetical protein
MEVTSMKRSKLYSYALLAAVSFSAPAWAGNSAPLRPIDDRTPKEEDDLDGQLFDAYLQELQLRYPDVTQIDVKRFAMEEGEKVLTMYCKAMGIDGPCILDDSAAEPEYVPIARNPPLNWTFDWLAAHISNVGVIPHQDACPDPRSRVEIRMDDENSNNWNYRKGWVGAASSGRDTAWRYCRENTANSSNFSQWRFDTGINYAMPLFGFFCPRGGRMVRRYQDNQDFPIFFEYMGYNGYTGDIFPNFIDKKRNWTTYYCFFDAGSPTNAMLRWPSGSPYGVFISPRTPYPYVLEKGTVFQDDEDVWNENEWGGNVRDIMFDGADTGHHLGRVR